MRAADYKDNAAKKAALQDAKISDDEKEYIYMEKFVQDKSKEKEQSRIRALREAGIGMNDYLKIRMKYGQIYDYKDAEARMRQWLQEEGFSWQEQSVIKEQFIFWGMHPKKYKGNFLYHHFVDRNKMKRKFAEKGVFLYTPFCKTCYNSSAETESCQVSFSLSCRAAFFPLPGQPGTNAA